MPGWLADGLDAALASVPGSPERDQVLGLLRAARRVRLSDEVVAAVADTICHAAHTVERNLDRIVLPDAALWLEYKHAPRAAALASAGGEPGHRGHLPETVGCLVACNPADRRQVSTFVAWRYASGAIHHAYALLHWDRARLYEVALAAPARPDGLSGERMLEAAVAAIPPGLMSELEVWQGVEGEDHPWRGEAVIQTQRDATGEHLFLLAAILLLESSAVTLSPAPAEPDAPLPEAGARHFPVANDNAGQAPCAPGANAPTEPAGIMENAFVVSLAPARARWPWQPRGFRSPLLGGVLAWSPPVSTIC